MKPALLLPIAVALLLAGSVVSWWRIPDEHAGNGRTRAALGLLSSQSCSTQEKHDCDFFDTDSGAQATVRHYTFLIGVIAAALLIALRAAPIGSRLRAGVASASLLASAAALMIGLALLCVMIAIAIEVGFGMPGLGGLFYVGGAVLGLRTSRLLVAADGG